MNGSTPGLPVHHQLPEFIQTHVRRVGDAIQPSHPLSSPSPPAPNPSQHQGLFQWVNSSHEVVKVLEFQLQHQSFQWTPRTNLLLDGLVGSPCSPRDSQESVQWPSKCYKASHSKKTHFPLSGPEFFLCVTSINITGPTLGTADLMISYLSQGLSIHSIVNIYPVLTGCQALGGTEDTVESRADQASPVTEFSF